MRRPWWRSLARGRAPSEQEIAEELRFHLELLEQEERARGLDAGAAREKAEARFGDVRLIERQVSSAWGLEGPLALRLARTTMLCFACLLPAWALKFARFDVADWPLLSFTLPAMLLATIPVAIALGVALTFVGGPSSPGPLLLMRRRSVVATLAAGSMAAFLAAGLYLVVPMTNAQFVEKRRSATSSQRIPFRGVKAESVPVLLSLLDPAATAAATPASTWAAGLSPRRQATLAWLARVELHERAALSMACLPFAFAGLAAGAWCARRRLGRVLACASGIAAAGVYYAASELWPVNLEVAGSAALAVWAPNLALTAVVIVVLALRWRWERSALRHAG